MTRPLNNFVFVGEELPVLTNNLVSPTLSLSLSITLSAMTCHLQNGTDFSVITELSIAEVVRLESFADAL